MCIVNIAHTGESLESVHLLRMPFGSRLSSIQSVYYSCTENLQPEDFKLQKRVLADIDCDARCVSDSQTLARLAMVDPFSSIHILPQSLHRPRPDSFSSPAALQAISSSSSSASSSSQKSTNANKKAKVVYTPSARISRHIQDKETARLEEVATARERGDDEEVQGRRGLLGRLRDRGVKGVLGRH